MPEQYELDEIITLKKTHPCGGNQWKVVRLGADIGLECLTCQRKIMLSRRELARRTKQSTSPKRKEDTESVSLPQEIQS